MKHLKYYESFNPEDYDDEPLTRTEEIFGKQTRLEKQFGNIVVKGLVEDETGYWATFNALKMELIDIIGKDNFKYKELMHRIVEEEDPTSVMNDICQSVDQTDEMTRLITKLNKF